MQDKSIEKEKIKVDFVGDSVPDSVKNFMPDVYADGDKYVCVLGSGDSVITGEGESIEAAMKNWDEKYQQKNPKK
jgi:hypothetical protein